MKSISFDQLPVGTDFYCFGDKWNKVSDGAAAQAAPFRGRRAGIAGWRGEGISTTADPS
jgi:hypothetical protein